MSLNVVTEIIFKRPTKKKSPSTECSISSKEQEGIISWMRYTSITTYQGKKPKHIHSEIMKHCSEARPLNLNGTTDQGGLWMTQMQKDKLPLATLGKQSTTWSHLRAGRLRCSSLAQTSQMLLTNDLTSHIRFLSLGMRIPSPQSCYEARNHACKAQNWYYSKGGQYVELQQYTMANKYVSNESSCQSSSQTRYWKTSGFSKTILRQKWLYVADHSTLLLMLTWGSKD